MAKKRYKVQRCDEGGTLTRGDGTAIDHTWDVVDTQRKHCDDGGCAGATVSNHDTRKVAREEAERMNAGGAR